MVQTATMIWFTKHKQTAPLQLAAERPPQVQQPDNLRNMAQMTERLGVGTAPASWPSGVSLLAQAVDACQRCDAGNVCADWLARAPNSIQLPPQFCANAETFKQVKKARG